MSTPFESDLHKSPETLEREIDEKRASIGNIVDSLESRFTPGQLFDQALAYTKGNGGEFFQNLGTTLKNNPVPTVLTGLGLAWLAMNQNKPFNPGTPSAGPGLGEKLSGAAGQVSSALSHANQRLHTAADKAMAKGTSIKEKATDLSHRASDSVDSTSGAIGDNAHAIADQISTQAGQLKARFDHVLKEQPLVLAAVGIALGAVLGASLPTTRKEDDLMGKASDSAISKFKTKGEEAYAAAKGTVEDAMRSTGDSERDEPQAIAQSPVGEARPDLSSAARIQP